MHDADPSSPNPSEDVPPRSRSRDRPKWNKVLRIALIAVASVTVLMIAGVFAWANIGVMNADDAAIQKVRDNPAISVHETPQSFILSPTGTASGDGLVFIPGAKVAADSYLFKLSGAVAQSGITVVVTKPILNLAFFDQRSLDTFTEAAPDVTRWFVGGHSLGGVRACQYAQQPDVRGLVLFASYCANDLADVDTTVLSLSGSNDLLSTPEKVMAAADLLPTSTTFFPIEGANHAGFGNYGVQAGDGIATLDDSVVRDIITQQVSSFIVAQ